MREKLIELIRKIDGKIVVFAGMSFDEQKECLYSQLADHLIANGVLLLPCKIGKTVYVITYCSCGRSECYEKQHCYKKETARTPKVLARKMLKKYGWKNVWNMSGETDKIKSGWQHKGTICYRVFQKPFELKMLTEVGRTVFLTLEDAEQALEERKQN